MNQNGSTLLEVLVAITLFSIVFLAVNRTIAVSMQLSSESDIAGLVSAETDNLLVSQFEKDSEFVKNTRCIKNVGEQKVIRLSTLKLSGLEVERSVTIRKISDRLWNVKAELSWLDKNRKRRSYNEQTVISYP
jgi:prepilin-type N-terminal cleavage/methylation domain-containing protein